MTTEQKVEKVQTMLDHDPEATDAVVEAYLGIAEDAVLDQLYPFGYHVDTVTLPARYHGAQCTLAARYFARRGGMGEVSHGENGVTRTWYSADDRDVLSRIIPKAKVR